jgi:hypothetical protein
MGKHATQKKRGRPATFKLAERRQLAELMRQHGARRTRDLSRNPISVGNLLKIAHEFPIDLKKGRRPRNAA